MFKVESYITPLLLSYVDKYVKNLKPEDSQVSLWGGDAVFHNLELRLDVLQQELALPFSFLSGHILELRIHVPWTKLTSEPILITINTIELVFKLPGDDASEASSQSSRAARRGRRDQEAPPGYIQSLINKIVNNVSIICNNLILKYVEEDLVLSLNVRSVAMTSADANWQEAFTEPTLPDLMLRKVVTLHDLTVCLDCRDAAGKIDVYQEPLLYRGSLMLRICNFFESFNSKQPFKTRMDMMSEKLEFSLTDKQLPMFIRLIQLALALYYGDLTPPKIKPSQQEPTEGSGEDEDGQSWGSWAWSWVPSVSPIYWEEEENQDAATQSLTKTLQVNAYIKHTSWTFKLMENGTWGSKTRFTPFLKFLHDGSFLEMSICGMSLVNVQFGVSHATLQASSSCFCGVSDGDGQIKHLLELGRKPKDECKTHANSLFDENSPENEGKPQEMIKDWDQHVMTYTEEALLTRSPAFAMDYLYCLTLPEDIDSEQLSELAVDLENSDLPERALCRLLFGPHQIHVCSALIHRVHFLVWAAQQWDFSPYGRPQSNVVELGNVFPNVQEIEAVEANTPLRVYRVSLLKPTIYVHGGDHPEYHPEIKRKHQKKSNKQKKSEETVALSIVGELVDAEMVKPMYPARIIKCAARLQKPSATMIHNCHRHFTIKFCGVHCNLHCETNNIVLMKPFSTTLHYRELLLPNLWRNMHQSRQHVMGEGEGVILRLSHSQLLLMAVIAQSLQKGNNGERFRNSSILKDACNTDNAVLEVAVGKISGQWSHAPSHHTFKAQVHKIEVWVEQDGRGIIACPIVAQHVAGMVDVVQMEAMLGGTASEDTMEDTISLMGQFPCSPTEQGVPPMLILTLNPWGVVLEPRLFRWICYTPSRSSPTNEKEADQGSNKKRRLVSEIIDKPVVPTVTESEETESHNTFTPMASVENVPSSRWIEKWLQEWQVSLSCSMIGIKIGSSLVCLPQEEATMVVTLPRAHVHSSNFKQDGGLDFPSEVPYFLPSVKVMRHGMENFPWSMSVEGLGIVSYHRGIEAKVVPLVHPIRTKLTLALSTKFKRAPESVSPIILSQLGFCLHADMGHVQATVTKEQVCLMASLLNDAIEIVDELFPQRSTPYTTPMGTASATEIPEDSIVTPITVTENEEKGVDAAAGAEVALSLWLQWTIPRVELSLLTNSFSEQDKLKLSLEAEDITTAVDMQRPYIKVKSKVAGISGYHYIFSDGVWQKQSIVVSTQQELTQELVVKCPELMVDTPSASSQLPAHPGYMQLTITRAVVDSGHHRWNALVRKRFNQEEAKQFIQSSIPCVSEVDIKLRSTDIVLNPDWIIPVVGCLEPFTKLKFPNKSEESSSGGCLMSSASLPLMYLASSAVRVFIPHGSSRPGKTSGADGINSDTVIVQADRISLTSQVENPLPRVVLKARLYRLAEKARITQLPSSAVEDRQYQLDVSGLSVSTGNYQSIWERSSVKSRASSSEILKVAENPALEWNTAATDSRSPCWTGGVPLDPFLCRMELRISFAPAVVYSNIVKYPIKRAEVVCGHSLEVNARSPIETYCSLHQLSLLFSLMKQFTFPSDTKEDSSIKTPTVVSRDSVPLDVLLTGSRIGIRLFESQRCPIEASGDAAHDSGFGSQSALTTKGSPESTQTKLKVEPLVLILVSQPHLLMTVMPSSQRLEISCFDLSLNTVGHKKKAVDELPANTDFPWRLFETKPGQPHPKTGIPPALFTLSVKEFHSAGTAHLAVSRPAKVNFSLNQCNHIKYVLKELTERANLGSSDAKTTSDDSLLLKLKSAEIETVDLIASLQSCGSKPSKVELSLLSSQGNLEIMQDDDSKGMSVAMDMTGLKLSTCYQEHCCNILDPAVAGFKVTFCSTSSPNLKLRCSSPALMINAGHIQMMTIMELYKEWEKELLEGGSTNTKQPVEKKIEREQYEDDLRSGEFQFVEGVAEDQLTQGQLSFDVQAGCMTWCYPQARQLSRVEAFPVPFVAPSDTSWDMCYDYQIQCALKYWDEVWETWLTHTVFPLSENQSFLVEIPEQHPFRLPVMSNKWRVQIGYTQDGAPGFEEGGRIHVSPHALAACLRIDSCHDSQFLPKSVVMFNIQLLQMTLQAHTHLLNDTKLEGYPGYTWDRGLPSTLELGVVSAERLAGSWTEGFTAPHHQLSLKGAVCIKLMEFHALTWMYLLNYTHFQGNLLISKLGDETEDMSIEVDSTIESLDVILNQEIVHTISMGIKLWNKTWDSKFSSTVPVLTHYVFCNDSALPICIGQENTTESILLPPSHTHQYAWRTHTQPLRIRICLEKSLWHWSESLSILEPGMHYCRLPCDGQTTTLIVQVKEKAPTQFKVAVSGQLLLANMLSSSVEARVLCRGAGVGSPQLILKAGEVGPSLPVDPSLVTAIKFRFANESNRLWSSGVSLQGSKPFRTAVLRIPLDSMEEFTECWCQMVVHQKEDCSRVLVSISPMCMVRSWLPQPVSLKLEKPNAPSSYQFHTLKGRGSVNVLQPEDLGISLKLTLQLSEKLPRSDSPVPFSYNMVEEMAVGDEVRNGDLEALMENLSSELPTVSPYKQAVTHSSNLQPKINVGIRFSRRWMSCNTLLVELRPKVLLYNNTQLVLALTLDTNSESNWLVLPGDSFAPPPLESTFHVGVCEEEQFSWSEPLQLGEGAWGSAYWPRFLGTIPLSGTVQLVFSHPTSSTDVFIVSLRSGMEQDMRVLTVEPAVVVSGGDGISVGGSCWLSNSSPWNQATSCPSSSITMEAGKTYPVVKWSVLGPRENARAEPDLYIQIREEPDGVWSYPGSLPPAAQTSDHVLTYTVQTLDAGTGMHGSAWMMSVHQRCGVRYLILNKCTQPHTYIYNMLPFPVHVGHSKGAGVWEDSKAWKPLPVVRPRGLWPYHLSEMWESFPEIQQKNALPTLHFAKPSLEVPAPGIEEIVKWSSGVILTTPYDQFVRLGELGDIDVRVRVERVGPTFYVFLSPLHRIGIPAKEIRRRIMEATTDTDPENRSEKPKVEEEESCSSQSEEEASDLSEVNWLPYQPALPYWLSLFCSMKVQRGCVLLTDVWSCVKKTYRTGTEQDIMAVTVEDLVIGVRPTYDYSTRQTSLKQQVRKLLETHVCIGDIQIDSHLYRDFPVMLIKQDGVTRTPLCLQKGTYDRVVAAARESSMVVMRVLMDGCSSQIFLEDVDITTKPLSLYLEDCFFSRAHTLLVTFLPESPSKDCGDDGVICREVEWSASLAQRPLMARRLHVSQFDLLLSLHANLKLYIALDQSPLSFRALDREWMLTHSYRLGQDVAVHYLTGALRRAGWLVGSLELVGSPGVLARSVGFGVRDFFTMPYRGLFQGPWAFLSGMTHGSASLLVHITAGSLTSVTNLASSVSRNLDWLSLDEEHSKRREERRRIQPEGVTDGLTMGLSELGISLLGAISGLAHHPMQTLINDGVKPLVLVGGVGKGLVGIVTKPLGGAAELLAQTGKGLLRGVGWSKPLRPRKSSTCLFVEEEGFSGMKVCWKVLPFHGGRNHPHVFPATDSQNVCVILVVTAQELIVVSAEQDCILASHPLEGLTPDDSGDTFQLMLSPPSQDLDDRRSRVAEFVASTTPSNRSEEGDGASSPVRVPPSPQPTCLPSLLRFHLSPRLRPMLLSVLLEAQARLQGRGFS